MFPCHLVAFVKICFRVEHDEMPSSHSLSNFQLRFNRVVNPSCIFNPMSLKGPFILIREYPQARRLTTRGSKLVDARARWMHNILLRAFLWCKVDGSLMLTFLWLAHFSKAHLILNLRPDWELAQFLKVWSKYDCLVSSNLAQGLYTKVGPEHSLILCGVPGGTIFAPNL